MEQLQLAKKLFDSLLRVFSIFKLYPENSPHRQQAVTGFYSELVSFLGRFGLLAFDLQKKEVFCLGEVIFEQTGRSGEFALALYHEGLHWLEFLDGVSLEELETLFEILDEYSRPNPVPGQQELIVRLWDAQFSHIVFQNVDDLEEPIPEVEPNSERLALIKEKNIPDICAYLLSLPEGPEFARTNPMMAFVAEALNPEEELVVERMKTEDDSLDPLSEIFAALAHVCSQSDEKELLVAILELLRDGIIQAVDSRDLETSARMLTALRKFSNSSTKTIGLITFLKTCFVKYRCPKPSSSWLQTQRTTRPYLRAN